MEKAVRTMQNLNLVMFIQYDICKLVNIDFITCKYFLSHYYFVNITKKNQFHGIYGIAVIYIVFKLKLYAGLL